MKILYHHRTLRKGVEGVHIAGVIGGLRALGHEVLEVALVGEAPAGAGPSSAAEPAAPASGSGWKRWVRALAELLPNVAFRICELFYNVVCLSRLTLCLLRHRDIAVIYDRYAYFCFATVLAGKLFGIPVISEMNIITDFNDTRELHFSRLCRGIEQWIMENTTLIVFVSGLLGDKAVERGIPREKICIQHNGFDEAAVLSDAAPLLRRAGLVPDEGTVVVGFLGRLLPWYRLEELIRIIAELHPAHPGIRLLIVGDGVERQRLALASKEYRVEDRVHFAGALPHTEAMTLVAQFDICVLPATNEWTSPVKLFEYLGLGKPVVAPRFASIAGVMEHDVHGKLFQPGDFGELMAQLEDLVRDPGLRLRLGRQARQRILDTFTWKHVADNTLKALRQAQPPGSRPAPGNAE
jgi:glycosyltransferase involved in cell wall biosynthesis